MPEGGDWLPTDQGVLFPGTAAFLPRLLPGCAVPGTAGVSPAAQTAERHRVRLTPKKRRVDGALLRDSQHSERSALHHGEPASRHSLRRLHRDERIPHHDELAPHHRGSAPHHYGPAPHHGERDAHHRELGLHHYDRSSHHRELSLHRREPILRHDDPARERYDQVLHHRELGSHRDERARRLSRSGPCDADPGPSDASPARNVPSGEGSDVQRGFCDVGVASLVRVAALRDALSCRKGPERAVCVASVVRRGRPAFLVVASVARRDAHEMLGVAARDAGGAGRGGDRSRTGPDGGGAFSGVRCRERGRPRRLGSIAGTARQRRDLLGRGRLRRSAGGDRGRSNRDPAHGRWKSAFSDSISVRRVDTIFVFVVLFMCHVRARKSITDWSRPEEAARRKA